MRSVRQVFRLCAVALVLSLGCGSGGERFDAIYLVALEGLRPDHLGSSGYPRPTSPTLDALLPAAQSFARAYTPMPQGEPAIASALTGRYPQEHGLRGDGTALDAALPTLPGVLAAAGFATAAVMGPRGGFADATLARDFAHLDALPSFSHKPFRPAAETADAAIAWLAGCADCERVFLFTAFHDIVGPYRSTIPNTDRAAIALKDEDRQREFVDRLFREHGIPPGFFRYETRRVLRAYDGYDSALRAADAGLGRLMRGVEALGRPGRALWVVFSPHGMGLGHHFRARFGDSLDEAQVRALLLFRAQDGSLVPARHEDVVELVDLAPTLLELAGLSRRALPGARGRSLAPLLRGETLAPRAALVERGPGALPEDAGEREMRELVGDPAGEQYAWIEAGRKLVLHTRGEDQLYDLAADPRELRNRAGEAPQQAEALRAGLRARLDEIGVALP